MNTIHTCTPEEGEMGEPSRSIDLGRLDHSRLVGAYFVCSSNFFDDPDLAEKTLVLVLDQVIHNAPYSLYEQYRIELLKQFGDVEDLSLQWEVHIATVGWPATHVDAKIREVLQFHNAEVTRLSLILGAAERQN